MKNTSDDLSMYRALSPIDVRAYLTANGWREERVLPQRGGFWQNPAFPGRQVPVPASPSVGDYSQRLRDMVEILAQLQNCSPLSILSDLQRSGVDLIRLRLSTPGIDEGSLPLEVGVALHAAARDAIYASAFASASAQPRPYYQARPPQAVSDFMEQIRLGQTERGSYIINIESPVAPALFGAVEAIPPPFARQVSETLARSLHALSAAASTGDAQQIQSSVQAGVSANLCDALAGALSHAGQQGELEIRFTWAQTRPTAISVSHFEFNQQQAAILSEAARWLRSIAELDAYEVEGIIHQLSQDNEAILFTPIEGRNRRVRTKFPAHYREALIRAFDNRSLIRCTGELCITPTSAELRHPRNLVLLPLDE
jgi:hypothetical protein